MLKPFSLIFFCLVLVWLGSIVVTSDPTERIDRSCSPLTIVDKAAVATALLLNEQLAAGTKRAMADWQYGCRFIVWKVFYEGDWQMHAAQAAAQDTAQQRRAREEAQQDGDFYKDAPPLSALAHQGAQANHADATKSMRPPQTERN
jgi:hypothetical protein